jgi:hypothetical protein
VLRRRHFARSDTKRIDQFAREGFQLLNFAPEAQCTPSRTALLTGRHAIRTGNHTVALAGAESGIVAWERTLGDVFSDAGVVLSMQPAKRYCAPRCLPENSRSGPCRWCSKLCSERVDKRQIGTGWDRIALARFSAGNRKTGRDSREGARALVGLANRRLQPLGHLTADAKYT